ncbi:MAG: transposase, OrfB family [Paenibacillaceae bacterium]|nr:transposase, OrfB family [Paenibacillaceae bacterium]
MSDTTMMYRTHQVWIKPGYRLFAYLEQACQKVKNLYNTTNFYIRQVFTYGRNEPLQPLQQQVMDTLEMHIDAINERRCEKNRSRPLELPSREQPFVSYPFLDALFRVMDQPDYRALPAQSSQSDQSVLQQDESALHGDSSTRQEAARRGSYLQTVGTLASKASAADQGRVPQSQSSHRQVGRGSAHGYDRHRS